MAGLVSPDYFPLINYWVAAVTQAYTPRKEEKAPLVPMDAKKVALDETFGAMGPL
jgi:hypothetical protein